MKELNLDKASSRAILANAVYTDSRENIGEWIFLDYHNNPESGYYGAVYKSHITNEIIIAHRGTEPTDIGDIKADALLGIDILPQGQMQQARDFIDQVALENNIKVNKINHTGHSLGGALAQLVGITDGSGEVWAYNAPGISHLINDLENYTNVPSGTFTNQNFVDIVTQVNTKGDSISQYGTQVGTVYEISTSKTIVGKIVSTLIGVTPVLDSLYGILVKHNIETLDIKLFDDAFIAYDLAAATYMYLDGKLYEITGDINGRGVINEINYPTYDPDAGNLPISDGSALVMMPDKDGIYKFTYIPKPGSNKTESEVAADISDAISKTGLTNEQLPLEGSNIIDISRNTGYSPAPSATIEKIALDNGYTLEELFAINENRNLAARMITDANGANMFLYKDNDVLQLSPVDNDFEYIAYNRDGIVFDSGIPIPVRRPEDIDNSYLDFQSNIGPDSNNAADTEDAWRTGSALHGGDYSAEMPVNVINGDGFTNTEPSSYVTDSYRPGAKELADGGFSRFIDNTVDRIRDIGSGITKSIEASVGFITGLFSSAPTVTNIDPLVVDLDGDGVSLISFNDSRVSFDVDNDGFLENTGWVSGADGIIVHDKNGDKVINNITETISEYYTENVVDGLEALATLDSNNDDIFNNLDNSWDDLRVWQDANEDGVTDEGELKTFKSLNITSINLRREIIDRENLAGNSVLSRSTMIMGDDSTREVAAVDFATNSLGYEWNDVLDGAEVRTENNESSGFIITGTIGKTVDAAEKKVNSIYGNIGDDTLIGDAGNNWLIGGKGSDVFAGGAGDDFLVIDADDNAANIDAGEGFDNVRVADNRGVKLNLNDMNAEVVKGGGGNDFLISGGLSNVFISGGAGNDIIIGGAADDALAGEDGDDLIDGGQGDDILRGHRGKDVLIGGLGGDYLEGGQGDDILKGGEGNDILIGGAGNDNMHGGAGFDMAEYENNYDSYIVRKTAGGFEVEDAIDGSIDTLTDIERIRFGSTNLNIVSSDSIPLPVKDDLTINGYEPVTIIAAELLGNDLDLNGDALSIHSVSDAVGGTVELLADGNILFTPDEYFLGNMSFDYIVKDAAGNIANTYLKGDEENAVHLKVQVNLHQSSDPVDPLFYNQWHFSEIRIKTAWQDYTGNGINIGIFEGEANEAFNYTHTDLDDNIYEEYLNNIPNLNIDSFSDHATLVAGVIGAERNDEGGVGIAYGSKLAHHNWSVDIHGISNMAKYDIANNSWAIEGIFSDNFDNHNTIIGRVIELSLESASFYGRNGLGTAIIQAGGNERQEGDNVNYHNMLNSRFNITVGSINQEGNLSKLINVSTPFSNPGAAILVSAPGSNIHSTSNLLKNENGSTFGGDFETTQGTSFSAPIISGVVALILEANSQLGMRDIQKILAYSARNIDDAATSWQYNGATTKNGGGLHFSNDYGFGIVDVHMAVRLAETWSSINNMNNEINISAENDTAVNIADNSTVSGSIAINSDINIEYVEVTVDIDHKRVGDLIITLISPDGKQSILLDRPGKAPDSDNSDLGMLSEDGLKFTLSSANFYGGTGVGEWQLEIADMVTGESGILNKWELKIFGSDNDGNDVYIFTDELGTYDEGNYIITDSFGIDEINAVGMLTDSVINLNAGSISIINNKNINIAGDTIVENAYGGDGDDILIDNLQDNILYGGRGGDNFTGNAGADIFRLKKNAGDIDVITDFEIANNNEKIDLTDFSLSSFSDLSITQNGNDSIISFNEGQQLILKNIASKDLSEDNFSGLLNQDIIHEGTISNDNLYGDNRDDIILAKDGNDYIDGGKGNNILTGGSDADKFFISLNANGTDIITDFDLDDSNERIVLTKFTGILSFKDLNILQSGSDAVINLHDGQRLVIKNADIRNISDENFIFYNQILGNEEANILLGSRLEDNIFADSGDDYIEGGDNDDHISGGDGNDTIYGGHGNDTLSGNSGSDKLQGGLGNDTIDGGGGNDIISGGAGKDSISGDSGDDIIDGGTGDDLILGGEGNDTIFGGSGDDILNGNTGDDTILGGEGNDTIDGGTGDDIIYSSLGNDILTGGEGNDIYGIELFTDATTIIKDFDITNPSEIMDFTFIPELIIFSNLVIEQQGADAVIILPNNQKLILQNINKNNLSSANFNLTNLDVIKGNEDDNTLEGSYSDDVIDGHAGNDKIYGHAGDDRLFGSEGDDTINGGSGDDILKGGAGDDVLYASAGVDIITGGPGGDTFAIESHADAVTYITDFDVNNPGEGLVDFTLINTISAFEELTIEQQGVDTVIILPDNQTVILQNIDKNLLTSENFSFIDSNMIEGTAGDDIITGSAGDDVIYGYEGNDTINLGIGVKEVYGGDGDDLIRRDHINGIILSDDSIISGDDGNDEITIISHNHVILGGAGKDRIQSQGNGVFLDGGTGSDLIHCWGEDANIAGGEGDDYIGGFVVDSIIDAGIGDDTIQLYMYYEDGVMSPGSKISGGAGNDNIFISSNNNNIIYGDEGNDYIRIEGIQGSNNIMHGGSAGDVFAFVALNNSVNIIADFEINNPDEKIDLQFIYGMDSSFAALNIMQEGEDTVINLPEDQSIILKNIIATDLTEKNFTFQISGDNRGGWLIGTKYQDVIIGGSGDEVIYGRGGEDHQMAGGGGADIFVFNAFDLSYYTGYFNNNHYSINITDFEVSNDVINIVGFEGAESFEDLVIDYNKEGEPTRINGKSFTFYLNNIAENSLTAANFSFEKMNIPPMVENITAFAIEDGVDILGTFIVNDIDNDITELTYNILSSPVEGDVINNNDGTFTFSSGANFQDLAEGETRDISFIYKVTDSAGADSDIATATITVTGTNDAPTSISLDNLSVDENTAGVIIGNITVSDIDAGDKYIFGINDPRFEIVAGQLKLKAGELVKYKSESEITVTVAATDNGKLSVQQQFIIAVNDHTINGTDGNDTLIGTANNNEIFAKKGSDLLDGGAGDDILHYSGDAIWSTGFTSRNAGSPGVIIKGEHVAVNPNFRSYDGFEGGDGYDVIKMTDDAEAIFLEDDHSDNPFGYNTARLRNIEEIDAGGGNDIVDLTSQQFVYGDVKLLGGSGDDVLWASSGDDIINGGIGNDNIDGGAGNDRLLGGDGNDLIHGRDGDDIINGGSGADIIMTGLGTDSINFSFLTDSTSTNRDVITDFEQDTDILNFEELAQYGIINFNDITVTNDGNNSFIAANDSDFEVELSGIYYLTESDFSWG